MSCLWCQQLHLLLKENSYARNWRFKGGTRVGSSLYPHRKCVLWHHVFLQNRKPTRPTPTRRLP